MGAGSISNWMRNLKTIYAINNKILIKIMEKILFLMRNYQSIVGLI